MTGPTTNGPMPTANSLSLADALVTAMLKSEAAISPTAPPAAFPCTRLITNLGARIMARITRANPLKNS